MYKRQVLYLAVFIGYPVVYNLVMSVQEVNVGNLRHMNRPFVGLANYVKLVDDPLFWTVTRNTAVFVAVNVSLQCVGGLALAMYFAQRFPGAGWLRGLILAGWMLPPLVIGAVWKWMLTSDNGIVNFALQWLGLASGKVYWLSDPDVALASVTVANIWFGLPFNMILIAAGLAGIPRDIYEAAALDGAGAVRRFFSITLPLLAPTLYALVAVSYTHLDVYKRQHLVRALAHRGQADARERVGQRVVVDADDGHLLRHSDPGHRAGLHQVPRARIGDCDDAHRLVEGSNPVGQRFDRAVPVDRAGLQAAVHASAGRQPREGPLALLGPAVAGRLRQAVHRQGRQAGFHQVVVRELDELEVVGRDVGHAGRIAACVGVGAAHGHHRDGQVGKRGPHVRIVVVGNDAVDPPLRQAGQAGAEVVLEEQVPVGAGRVQVGADAFDDLAVVDLVGVEQQHHVMRRVALLPTAITAR